MAPRCIRFMEHRTLSDGGIGVAERLRCEYGIWAKSGALYHVLCLVQVSLGRLSLADTPTAAY